MADDVASDATNTNTISRTWGVLKKGKPYTLEYDDGCISWKVQNAKKSNDTSKIDDKTSRKIKIRHVLSVVLDEKQKAFTVNFIDFKPKYFWKRASQQFSSDESTDIVSILENAIAQVEERPKRLLVYVNPCSGKGNGLSVNQKYVEPVLKLANIESQTLVTTHAGHIKEHLQSADLSQFNGIVVVGGDGTFTEAFDALTKRNAKNDGVDLENDPSVELSQVPHRLGIVPAGTGQGMVSGATMTYDPETALLHIVAGYCANLDGLCVYNGGKLMAIGSMLFGYGFFGDVIKISEDNRQMGRLRYLYAMAKGMAKFRTVDLEVAYQKCPRNIDLGKQENSLFENGATNASAANTDDADWIKVEGSFKSVGGFMFDFTQCHDHSLNCQIAYSSLSRMQMVKQFIKLGKAMQTLMKEPESTQEPSNNAGSGNRSEEATGEDEPGRKNTSFIDVQAKAMRLRLSNITSEELQQLPTNAREVMNIDGEAFTLKHPEIEIRVHANVLRMFGVGYKQLRKPEWSGKKAKT